MPRTSRPLSFSMILLFTLAAPFARAADDAGKVKALEAQIAKLTQERDALKAELDALKLEVAALKAPDATPAGADLTLDAGAAAANANPASWVVEIVSIAVTSEDTARQRLESERKRLDEIDGRVRELKDRQAQMATAKTNEYEKNRGVEYQRKNAYSRDQIADARLAATKADNERRKQAQVVARLERELAAGTTARTVTGRLDDGTVVNLSAANDVAGRIVETLQKGKKYKVQGVGVMADGALELTVKSAAPADPTAIPAVPTATPRRAPLAPPPAGAAP